MLPEEDHGMLEPEENMAVNGSPCSVRHVRPDEFRDLLLSRRKLERVWTRRRPGARLYEPAARIVYVTLESLTGSVETPAP